MEKEKRRPVRKPATLVPEEELVQVHEGVLQILEADFGSGCLKKCVRRRARCVDRTEPLPARNKSSFQLMSDAAA